MADLVQSTETQIAIISAATRCMRWRSLCCAISLLVIVGCKSGLVYDASTLPAQYRATPSDQAPRILAGLAPSASWDSSLVYPGDLLDITIVTGVEREPVDPLKLHVDSAGNINLPPTGLGIVHVAGLTLTEAARAIRDASIHRDIYVAPSVSVVIADRKTNRITVTGAVNAPGPYDLPVAGSNLLDALGAAGDLSETAGTSIRVIHPASGGTGSAPTPQGSNQLVQYEQPAGESRRIDVDLRQGDMPDIRLQDGSVVSVAERVPNMVSVSGLVKKPGRYELPEVGSLRLLDAIAQAEGRTMGIADTVSIVRYVPGKSQPIRIEASLREAEKNPQANLVLAAGDTIQVQDTWVTYLSEFVRSFLRIGLSTPLTLN